MEHTAVVQPGQHAEGNPNEVKNVTIILSVLTLVELGLGFAMYKWFNDEGFMRHFIKGVIVILMLAKAFYIVSYFMHLGHELKNLIMTIVVPLFLFVWFIISFLYEGNSYKNNRMTYDRYKNEQSKTKVEKKESAEEGIKEAPKKPGSME